MRVLGWPGVVEVLALFNMSGGTVTVNSWVAVGRGGAGSGVEHVGWFRSGNGNSGNRFIHRFRRWTRHAQSDRQYIPHQCLGDTWIGENSDGIWNQSGAIRF